MGEQVAAKFKKEKSTDGPAVGIEIDINCIDTGKDEQQLITANPISRAVLL